MNHLKNETSPYLLQHADNPVDWYPWCGEAFERAKSEDKPVFLSIGYSTCHWCHVMAHESFENSETAELLNKNFISVKVDREERPDIDSVYMTVCQAFTGSGGWPMSIFMTWDKKPFFAGTYFPTTPRFGMPSFRDVLNVVVMQWDTEREKLIQSAENITDMLKNTESVKGNKVNGDIVETAAEMLRKSYDSIYGGFGSAPKFPIPHELMFLMYYAKINSDETAQKMAEKTLIQMRKGGIFDHIGGGFSRYSTDRYFLAPHFEKMLYDNALLIIAYSAMYSLTGTKKYLETAMKTAEYVLREMTSPEGGFYSAQDADSEGVEGKYYTFTLDEIMSVLGDKGKHFSETFDITEHGNFEGVNIPNLLKSGDLDTDFEAEFQKLYEYRKKRTKLHLDDKILLSWNSMMIAAMSMLYRVSHYEKYLCAAENAQRFIEENMSDGEHIYTIFRDGKRSDTAFLEDYAYYIAALIEMYNSTLDNKYLMRAEELCAEAVKRFSDKNGGFNMCETTELFKNPKELYDGAVPSGNSIMAYDLIRLHQLTEKEEYQECAEKQLDFMSVQSQDYPVGHCMFLLAKLLNEVPPPRVIISAKGSPDISNLPFLANVTVVQADNKYPLLNDRTTFYVCRGNTCLPPSNMLSEEL
ncbi:MAG TPA: thioredoxin domain-containing protein [Ruminococcus sp.]|nr:thioredoxin domain-containing protein [Ruminococcus sp.]